jgi:hypothetical protein
MELEGYRSQNAARSALLEDERARKLSAEAALRQVGIYIHSYRIDESIVMIIKNVMMYVSIVYDGNRKFERRVKKSTS